MIGKSRVAAVAGLAFLAGALAVVLAGDKAKDSGSAADPVVRQARLQLRMAEANLQKVRSMNQRVANLVSAEVVGEYREDVAIAQARLAAVEGGQGDNPFALWLRAAETAVKTAEARLSTAQTVSKKVSGVFDDLDLERLQLRVEMARVRLERGRALADEPRDAQLQWQIGVLADEVQRLREQARHTSPAGGVAPAYPLWWCY